MTDKKYPISNQEIVKYLSKKKTWRYLTQIYNGEIPSERHNIVSTMFESRKLDFGIHSRISRLSAADFLEDDQKIDSELWSILSKIFDELDTAKVSGVAFIEEEPYAMRKVLEMRQKYIFYVFVPEGIIKYLQNKFRWTWHKANEFFLDGESRITKEDLEDFDKEILDDMKKEAERKRKQIYESSDEDIDMTSEETSSEANSTCFEKHPDKSMPKNIQGSSNNDCNEKSAKYFIKEKSTDIGTLLNKGKYTNGLPNHNKNMSSSSVVKDIKSYSSCGNDYLDCSISSIKQSSEINTASSNNYVEKSAPENSPNTNHLHHHKHSAKKLIKVKVKSTNKSTLLPDNKSNERLTHQNKNKPNSPIQNYIENDNNCGNYSFQSSISSNGKNIVIKLKRQMKSDTEKSIKIKSPSQKESSVSNESTEKKSPALYCICQKEYDGSLMRECSHCKELYHPECIDGSSKQAILSAEKGWLCATCIEKISIRNRKKENSKARGTSSNSISYKEKRNYNFGKNTSLPKSTIKKSSMPTVAKATESRTHTEITKNVTQNLRLNVNKDTFVNPHTIQSDLPDLYCLCRQENDDTFMVGCDFCEEWYHPRCLCLSNAEAMDLSLREWQCPKCQ